MSIISFQANQCNDWNIEGQVAAHSSLRNTSAGVLGLLKTIVHGGGGSKAAENGKKNTSVQTIVASKDRAFILYSDMKLMCWSLEDGSLMGECDVRSLIGA